MVSRRLPNLAPRAIFDGIRVESHLQRQEKSTPIPFWAMSDETQSSEFFSTSSRALNHIWTANEEFESLVIGNRRVIFHMAVPVLGF